MVMEINVKTEMDNLILESVYANQGGRRIELSWDDDEGFYDEDNGVLNLVCYDVMDMDTEELIDFDGTEGMTITGAQIGSDTGSLVRGSEIAITGVVVLDDDKERTRCLVSDETSLVLNITDDGYAAQCFVPAIERDAEPDELELG